jgi:2-methylcitrate dehydratase PrpD
VALLFGEASLAQYTDSCVRDPAVLALRAKVHVEQDEAIDVAAAAIHMMTTDGGSLAINVAAARGSLARPLTDREIEDKLRALAGSWCAPHNVRPLIDAVWALDRTDDASLPIRLTAPAQT